VTGSSADLTVATDAPETVAAAVAPDDTDSVTTRAVPAEGSVRVRIDRETTGGLAATVDDAVVNLGVARAVVAAVRDGRPATGDDPGDGDAAGDDPRGDRNRQTNDADDTHHTHDT